MTENNEHGKLSRRIKRAVDATRARIRKLGDNAEWIFGGRAARVLGFVVLFAIVVALLLVFLNWYIAPTKPSDKKDLVLALAQILGGTALLSGLYFTWRTLQVNREGQITDRFTRAIDQLGKTDNEGNKMFEIRLGGIYALERIAKESEEDYWPIMEVLTAYVRQHAPRRPEERQEGKDGAAVRKKSEEGSMAESEPANVPTTKPDPDIQAIMIVLRRRTRAFLIGETEHLDLRKTTLSEAFLAKANLSGADLSGADLTAANLREANLRGANLRKSDLTAADLSRADLSEADLSRADLSEADLPEADLSGADLTAADLSGADLREANLVAAGLTGANFTGAGLSGADLSEVKSLMGEDPIIRAAVTAVRHMSPGFTGSYLSGPNLREADLTGANLRGADLREANLVGTNLSEAEGMPRDQLERAMGSNETRLPEGLSRPEFWSKSIEEQEKIIHVSGWRSP